MIVLPTVGALKCGTSYCYSYCGTSSNTLDQWFPSFSTIVPYIFGTHAGHVIKF